MQVGPDNFAEHSTRPQLFWKQWNRIRHKSVLMVGSVLWKGFSESLFSSGRRGSVVSPEQDSCCQDSELPCRKNAPAPLPPPPCKLNSGNLNKTNVRQISTRKHSGGMCVFFLFFKYAFITYLCNSKLLADVCGMFLNAGLSFLSTFQWRCTRQIVLIPSNLEFMKHCTKIFI